MKVLVKKDEDDIEYTPLDVVELSEDIDWLIDNKPKYARKGTKKYKQWIKSIEDRMNRYNDYVKDYTKGPIYNKTYNENI